MAINFDYYGKQDGQTAAARIAEATSYFAQRLHETAWTDATRCRPREGVDRRPRASSTA